jgi:peroxiredoxin
MERFDGSDKFPLGSKLPNFTLKGVDEKNWSSSEVADAKAILIVFTCNHCPYVIGSERMLVETVTPLLSQGLKAFAINSNDPVKYPDDSFEKMKEHALKAELPYPYLFDETQTVARIFDAECTPECYLFDAQKKLVYHGTVNDSPRDPKAVKTNYIQKALEQVLAGTTPSPQFVRPMGCSIKWVS